MREHDLIATISCFGIFSRFGCTVVIVVAVVVVVIVDVADRPIVLSLKNMCVCVGGGGG